MLDRIVIVDGYQRENLERFISSIYLNTSIDYIFNSKYLETNNIYSLYLAKEYLSKDDSIVLESDIIFEDQILDNLVLDTKESIAVIDKYKSWMTGQGVQLNDKKEVVRFIKENEQDLMKLLIGAKNMEKE